MYERLGFILHPACKLGSLAAPLILLGAEPFKTMKLQEDCKMSKPTCPLV